MNGHGLKKGLLFITGGILCFLAAAAMVWHFSGKVPDQEPTVVAGPLPGSVKERPVETVGNPSETVWVIYITGSVEHPGVYEIDSGSRVHNAVKKAGGLLPDADRVGINLAEKLHDGAHIHIPEVKTDNEQSHLPRSPLDSSTVINTRSPGDTNDSNSSTFSNALVDINIADSKELQALPGIGPVTAEKIITFRQKHGRFSSISELIRIKGIGEKKLEQVRPLISTGP